MTAIAAFNCIDGVVLAADSEETYNTDDKIYTHKLFPFVRPTSRICIAGAGNGYLIDYAKEKIIAAIDAGLKTANDTEISLIDILNGLYTKEFKQFPVASPSELAIQLLVAVQFVSKLDASVWMEPALFQCQSNLVTRVKQNESRIFGIGELLTELGAHFAEWGLTAALAHWASIYLIHDAKRRFGGVGGRTHTFRLMMDGTYVDGPRLDVVRAEQVLENLAKIQLLLTLSLSPAVTDDKSKDFLDAVRKWVGDARREIKNLERQRGKLKHNRVVIHDRAMKKMIRKFSMSPPPQK
jgi:hypothetical protein